MKNKTSSTSNIPLLIRSRQWRVAERTGHQVSAVRIRNEQDEKIEQLNRKLEQQDRIIEEQNRKIEQQQMILDQQNKNMEHLNPVTDQQTIEMKKSGEPVTSQNERSQKRKAAQKAILMADANSNSNATVFGSKIKRSEISAIFVKNTLEDVPANAWDVSSAGDGSVMAWTCTASDIVSRILYLAADGDIYANPNSSYLFAYYTKLTTADFSHLKTDLVTNMNNMFFLCLQLPSLDILHWNVSSVTNMRGMFDYCTQMKTLNISHWNVSGVTNMEYIFEGCERLEALNVSHWDVSGVTTMKCMFAYCKQLKVLDVSKWDVSGVTNMNSMFIGCGNLKALDVSHWNVSNVTDMHSMFCQCNQLKALDVFRWNVSNVTDMDCMFYQCQMIDQLKKGALTSWKLNPDVTMKDICGSTIFAQNPMDLFRPGLLSKFLDNSN